MTGTRRQQVAGIGRKVREAPRPNVIERRMSRYLREPPSVRLAASVIVTATMLIVVGGGVLMRVVDHKEYPTVWVGMWFALQTVTTVGYGDVTPKDHIGRIIAAFVMVEGIAFLTITTAAITSTFVARGARERVAAESGAEPSVASTPEPALRELTERLNQVESVLAGLAANVRALVDIEERRSGRPQAPEGAGGSQEDAGGSRTD